ncbi:hypothetical protein Ddye_004376 [Dipteronia dyeriana]|uniref:Reverse transcriptase n=1 Tax=Dipteronia dyeriana TaxID=168575 RepID=A0AAE0CW64_9ROSI|nr:hypothetical protein Ddye_004376 [Dipteronia dyeriana]
MNLFRLSKGFITEVHRLFALFWWESSDVEKRLHWGSWDKLCESKNDGGLGFCDLSLFNQAMLAKHCWRFIKWPNSLVVRVIKGRYFPTSDFLHATKCSSDSFVWKSFMWGRELIEAGSRWQIGNRSSTLIYEDRWIPRRHSFKVQSPRVLGRDAKVRLLLNTSAKEVEAILSIPTGSNLDDYLLWHFEKDGNYSLKSGYKLG